jgi:hypothetical protein
MRAWGLVPRRIDPVMAQCRQESHGLPTAMWNLGSQSVAAQGPSPQWSHIGPGPGLVDEDQPLRFDAILILCPLDAPPRYVGTIAFASHHAFLKLSFSAWTNSHTEGNRPSTHAPASSATSRRKVKSPALIRCDNQAARLNRLRLVTAHLAGCNAADLIDPLHPANRDPKLLGLICGTCRRVLPLSTGGVEVSNSKPASHFLPGMQPSFPTEPACGLSRRRVKQLNKENPRRFPAGGSVST